MPFPEAISLTRLFAQFPERKQIMNALEQLKQFTTVVADTGDFQLMKQYTPQDATTNPSLILKAVQKSEYRPLLEQATRDHHGSAGIDAVMDQLLIAFGCEILSIVPGRVSTEVDARLSFDTQATVDKARHLIGLYEQRGIARERVLIKIASTWEGIKAAEILQRENIRCNMTLLFSLVQAVACAEAGAQLISPFVGRILDWHKKQAGDKWDADANAGENDPGVRSVRQHCRRRSRISLAIERRRHGDGKTLGGNSPVCGGRGKTRKTGRGTGGLTVGLAARARARARRRAGRFRVRNWPVLAAHTLCCGQSSGRHSPAAARSTRSAVSSSADGCGLTTITRAPCSFASPGNAAAG